MKETKIFGEHIIIEGFRDVKLKNVDALLDQVKKETKGCHVQFFDARLIAGFDHLYFAVLSAMEAFETGINIAKNPAMETLLYVSGQHQISKAIELLGIKPSSSKIALVVIADTRSKAVKALDKISDLLQGEKCDEIIEMTEGKVEAIKTSFGIKDLEIEATLRKSDVEALTSLLVEHAALLATQS
jgi:tRNA threonylcarbamoyladenosine modification (KEOPS) complex Cgi121 subunit